MRSLICAGISDRCICAAGDGGRGALRRRAICPQGERFPQPSAANKAAFERAIDAIAANTRVLMEELVTAAPKRDREVETAKAKAKAALRYAKR